MDLKFTVIAIVILNFTHNTSLCKVLQTLQFLQNLAYNTGKFKIVFSLLIFDVKIMLWMVSYKLFRLCTLCGLSFGLLMTNITSRVDYSMVYSRSEVWDAYFKQVERLTKRVVTFQQEGSAKLSALASAPGLQDEQKALLMLNYRSTVRIPTKEPVGLDHSRRVVYQYQRRGLFQEECVLLEVARLA